MAKLPELSVVIPTHNNVALLQRCITAWRKHANDSRVELLVIEDGCSDGTAEYLAEEALRTDGLAVRWFHEPNVHELRSTNRGLSEARAPLIMSWHDDMFVTCDWLVDEIVATFADHSEIGMLCMTYGLDFYPLSEPIRDWNHLHDSASLRTTIGPRPWNWLSLQEVDGVIRPWVLRRTCLDRVGLLDEAYVPTEFDESDLAFRIRAAGWKVAVHGYQRLGAFDHFGSATNGKSWSAKHEQIALRNALMLRERWDADIDAQAQRVRRTWLRSTTSAGWLHTARRMLWFGWRALRAQLPGR